MSSRRIPYEDLAVVNDPFMPEIKTEVGKIIESGWFVLGQGVTTFESEFNAFIGANHCIAVNSGLDALTLCVSLVVSDDQRDEVLVPANTYIASILSIIHGGGVPVLVEPNLETYNVEAGAYEKYIGPRTKAIMPVHLYGQVCEMEAILALAKKYNLRIIEDCAQVHGAVRGGYVPGTADLGAYSFYPTKI